MTQPTMQARVYVLERDRDRHDHEIADNTDRITKVESRLDVLGTRVGIYAALGATVGGVVASAIAAVAVRLALG